jgi:hypothetical protein
VETLYMIGVRILLLLVVLVPCSLGPGFFFIRKFRWSPLEKLCGSVGLSLVLIYLAAFGIYVLKLPIWTYWVVSGLCCLLGLLSARDLSRMLSARQVRRPLAGFGFLLLWTLLLLGLVRHYSGGGWSGDWYEHYHRTIFFLDKLPVETVMHGGYPVPARPPMMNLLAVHFLAQVGRGFELFQVTFVFLNLLVFLPCCLIMRAMLKRGRRGVIVLICLLSLSPMFVVNLTYTWTKLLAGFYVVLGIWFYLAGWRKKDSLRTVVAFASLAGGALVHYSAGPFIVFIAIHYLAVSLRDFRAMWRGLAAVVLVSAALLSTWFGWSIATYGARVTFTSNTAVTPSKEGGEPQLVKIAGNAIDTLVPHPFRPAPLEIISQRNRSGYWRDYAFLMYQTNLFVAMGTAGGLVVVFLFLREVLARGGSPKAQRWFWAMLVLSCVALGIAVHGERDTFGVAHVTLQPVILLGLTFLAAAFPRLPSPARWFLIVGCVADFAAGILLHFRIQNLTFRILIEGGRRYVHASDAGKMLSSFAMGNCWRKEHFGVAFCGDYLGDYSALLQVIIVAVFLLILAALVREG